MISGENSRVIYFLAKKPTFDQCPRDGRFIQTWNMAIDEPTL